MNTQFESFIERALMDGIEEVVFVMEVGKNFAFYYKFINRTAMEKTGLTEEVIGKSLHEVYEEEKATYLSEQYKKVVDSRKSHIYEDSYLNKQNEKHYSKIKLTPLFNNDKKCTHVVALVQDITNERRSESYMNEYFSQLKESEQRFRSLFYYDSDAIFSLDLSGNILSGNTSVQTVTGYEINELKYSEFFTFIVDEYIEITKLHFQQALIGDVGAFQTALKGKKGDRVEISLKFTPIKVNNKVIGMYAVLKDITEIIKLGEELRHNEERFRIIAENAHDLITVLDYDGKIIYASPSHIKILGYPHTDYVGKFFNHNVHPEEAEKLSNIIFQSIVTRKACKLQFRQKHKTNGWIWCELHGKPVFDDEGRFAHMVVITRDISVHKNYEDKLKHFASHDPLTNLPNRRFFNKRLEKAIADFYEYGTNLAVIMLDIDHFKLINDQYGHDIGDKVIIEFGKRIKNELRQTDTIARLGGDEFVVLLSNIRSINNVVVVVEKILHAVNEQWQIKDHNLKVTTSIGVSISSENSTLHSMLKIADEALYKAKSAGRNTYVIK